MERLREEVGEVGVTAYERDAEAVRLDCLADVEVAPLDVLELAMVFGVASGAMPGESDIAAKKEIRRGS